MSISRVPYVIVACSVLHNIAVSRGLVNEDDYDFDLGDFGMNEVAANNGRGQNFSTRQHIIEQVFEPLC